MRNIIYDVAVSIDGYIAAPGGDPSAFPQTGPHVSDYMERLQTYETVIMGRNTYEFAYQFGLAPGARAYPHMEHHIFSRSINLPQHTDVNQVDDDWLGQIDSLKSAPGSPIYLCGGGLFAGFLLENHRIDRLRLKVAPLLLGDGIKLCAGVKQPVLGNLMSSKHYGNGVSYLEYALS
ncbi:MAG: dihydrofolate reductase family protein [Marinosulfonomonas sp.]|nr:dihydrofolate reductase family protein [Marinosulfonomonas sp.]